MVGRVVLSQGNAKVMATDFKRMHANIGLRHNHRFCAVIFRGCRLIGKCCLDSLGHAKVSNLICSTKGGMGKGTLSRATDAESKHFLERDAHS